ncbi:MAG: hypothetical protein ABIU58_12130 [Ramlibacter sp.]
MSALFKSVVARWHSPGAAKRSAIGLAALALLAVSIAGYWYRTNTHPRQGVEPSLSVSQQFAQEHCLEGAMLYHDVLWAYVCMKLAERGQGQDHPECDLPDAEAARLNALLQQADRKCMAETSR